jgi:DNA (cytosine-5)-methyltransferase 1
MESIKMSHNLNFTTNPKVLDLFCGGGGAAMGLYQAGFRDITGVDIQDMSDIYPFEFIQSNVFDLEIDFNEFELIWASPPCQGYCWGTKGFRNQGKEYPLLVPDTRNLLLTSGKPYVIENVPGAPLRQDLMLCGEMFNLRIIRHRYFEIHDFVAPQLHHKPHKRKLYDGSAVGVWSGGYHPGYWGNKEKQEIMKRKYYVSVAGHGSNKTGGSKLSLWQEVMEIDWINNKKILAEAVPPAYSRYIGSSFLQFIRGKGQRVLEAYC